MTTTRTFADELGRFYGMEFDTPEEAAAYEPPAGRFEIENRPSPEHKWRDGAWVIPEAIEEPLALQQIASVRLLVDGWDVTGLERCSGLSVAFIADTDTAWVFFDIEQPDDAYVVVPADGVSKFADHIEVTRPSLTTLNLIVQRVQ
jgi:hypothetical protein